jgi:hypothetical protein
MINKNKPGSVKYLNVLEYLSNYLNFCTFINTDLERKTPLVKSRIRCTDNVDIICKRKSCKDVE